MLAQIINTTLIITGVSAALAFILVVAEYFFANYGDCKITINGKREVTVKGGGHLLGALAENKIFIPSACGGRGSCGFCKVTALDGAGPILPTEKPYLTAQEMTDKVRLACQIKVKNDLSIEIPEELFNIRKFKARVAKIEDYTHDIKGVTFDLIDPPNIDFKAGQYVQLQTKPYGKVKQSVSRAYSISSTPENKTQLQLIIRLVPDGICTTWVHNHLQEGEEVNFTGPFGDFFIRPTNADILYVAGGSGKAPIKSMVEYLNKQQSSRRQVYLFGARTKGDLYLTEYFNQFEQSLPDFTYVPILSDPDPDCGWEGKTGYTVKYFKDYVKDPANTEAYLCGSPGMIKAVVNSLKELGVPEEKIYYDSFA